MLLSLCIRGIPHNIAVPGKQLAIGQPRFEIKWVDIGYPAGTNDAVDMDDGLQPSQRIVATPKNGHPRAQLPAHLIGSIVRDRLLQRNPRLGQALG